MAKIFVVEDDVELAGAVERWLSRENHLVEVVHDGVEADLRLDVCRFDLVIMDWNLPRMEGVELARRHRERKGTEPILMLTGRSTVPEKVQGLSAGADDYLTKPFQMEELSARVAALLRRPAAYTGSVLIVGAVELDTKRRRVTLSGQELVLEPKEHALLEYFMRHPGEIFSPESLLLHVWGSDSESSIDSVRTYIKKLRKKLSPGGPLIETVHTLGYRMNPS